MEYEKIKQLIEDVGNSKLTDINIEFPDGTKISMKKQTVREISNHLQDKSNDIYLNENFVEQSTLGENTTKIETKQDEGNVVKSPMVGTFYIKPSPTSEPYVQEGNDVKKGDTLCIIEAMKLMNEIESEFSGKIIKILVKDGEAVEYGTPLFVIK